MEYVEYNFAEWFYGLMVWFPTLVVIQVLLATAIRPTILTLFALSAPVARSSVARLTLADFLSAADWDADRMLTTSTVVVLARVWRFCIHKSHIFSRLDTDFGGTVLH